jgi:type I restriction enzyme S subunit
MRKYDSYKDSGVEWIGEIPSGWKLKRVGSVFNQRKETVSDTEYPPLSVTKNGIVPQMEGVAKTDNNDNRKLVKSGDFVINSRSDRKGSSGFSDLDGSVSVINIVLNPIGIFPKYSHFLFKSYLFIEEFFKNGKGIVMDLWSTRFSELKYMLIPIPPISEQQQIVSYLDRKTSQIDTLIEKTQRKIQLLKENRTSLINEVITKGLNPNVEMKDSGLEWIGEIPIHWEISRLDYLFNLFGRVGWKSLKSDEYVEKGYIFLSTPNIKGKKIDYENVNYISKERYEESPEIMLENDDVLLVKDGSTLGIVNIVENLPRPSTVNSSIGVLKKKSSHISSIFMMFFLSSDYQQNIINRIKGGMGVPHLFQSDIKKFSVLLPPISEQQQIVSYLDRKTSQIDKTISVEERRIELLKEYRQSLISEVVTGRIKVAD